MPDNSTAEVDHGLLAWHLLMERSRYVGKDFRAEMIKAFDEVEKSVKDTAILKELRKELNLEA